MSAPNLRQRWRDAIRDSDDVAIDGLARAVAFALDRHMAADGRTYTGGRLLAQLAGTSSLHVVQNRVNRLIDAGLLVREWAGRGHKAYYQATIPAEEVTREARQSEVTREGGHSEKVTRLRDEVTRLGAKSDAPHASDPDTTPTTPKGGGVGGAANAAAGAAPPGGVGDGPAGNDGAYMEWITNVVTGLGFDADEIDIYDAKLMDASTPLRGRTAAQIRNALGRQPKGLRERLSSPGRFVAKKLAELHALADDDPRWKPRPAKPKKAAPTKDDDGPKINGDWDHVYNEIVYPVSVELSETDAKHFDEGDQDLDSPLTVYAFEAELERVADFWEQRTRGTPFKANQVEAIREVCRAANDWAYGRTIQPDFLTNALMKRANLDPCRICKKLLAGVAPVVDGIHQFCLPGPPVSSNGHGDREPRYETEATEAEDLSEEDV